MDDASNAASWIALVALLLGNMVLTAGHNALVNARKAHLEAKAEAGNRNAALALTLGEDATTLFSTYRLSVTLLRFFAAAIAVTGPAPAFAAMLASFGLARDGAAILPLAQVIMLLFWAVVMLVLGEQLPAAIGISRADQLAPALARPMQVITGLLKPVSWLLRVISAPLLHLAGGETQVHLVTEEEIKTLVDAGQEEGVLETQEKDMILSIIELDNTAVREVMVPRLDMFALDIHTPVEEAIDLIMQAGHSRIPVYEENIDHIRGLLYAKDLLRLWRSDESGTVGIGSLLREANFVPEGKSAMKLLGDMQLKRIHLAIVVDEYGGTAGLVTLEDLIEEITGEIQDEYDINEEDAYQRISNDEYLCNARLDLDDLNRLLDLDLPTDESDTLGGYIFTQVGEVPEPGTVIETEKARLEVVSVEGRRIGDVRVTRLHRDDMSDPDEA